MGQIRQINGVYYIEFHARGLLYSQVAGDNLEEAQKLLRLVEDKITAGEALTITRYIDLPDFFERFLGEAKIQYGPKTVERFASTIRHFSGFLAKDFRQTRQLHQLTPAVMESYKAYLISLSFPNVTDVSFLNVTDMSFPNVTDMSFPNVSVGNLDPRPPIEAFGGRQKHSGMAQVKIINFTLLLLRDILDFGIKLGFINDNPTLHLRLLPWPQARQRRATARHELAKRLLAKGIGLGQCAQLLKFSDIAEILFYAPLIPLSLV